MTSTEHPADVEDGHLCRRLSDITSCLGGQEVMFSAASSFLPPRCPASRRGIDGEVEPTLLVPRGGLDHLAAARQPR